MTLDLKKYAFAHLHNFSLVIFNSFQYDSLMVQVLHYQWTNDPCCYEAKFSHLILSYDSQFSTNVSLSYCPLLSFAEIIMMPFLRATNPPPV